MIIKSRGGDNNSFPESHNPIKFPLPTPYLLAKSDKDYKTLHFIL